jgi:shikimate kinase
MRPANPETTPSNGKQRTFSAGNLFLIGYRCCGKTTVGNLLAKRVGWPFVDTDQLAVNQMGMSIADAIARNGWEDFRRLESQILKAVCGRSRQVVATGGGIVLAAENVALMHRNGTVAWLRAPAEVILQRMAADPLSTGQRPALTPEHVSEEVRRTLPDRQALYAAAADRAWPTDRHCPDEIAERIWRTLRDRGWQW